MKWIEVHDVEIEVAALDEIGPECPCFIVGPDLAITSAIELPDLIKVGGHDEHKYCLYAPLDWIKETKQPGYMWVWSYEGGINGRPVSIWELALDAHREIIKELLK